MSTPTLFSVHEHKRHLLLIDWIGVVWLGPSLFVSHLESQDCAQERTEKWKVIRIND